MLTRRVAIAMIGTTTLMVTASGSVQRAWADTEIVITTVERTNKPTSRVDWVVATNTGSFKNVDLLAGGTSLRLTEDADFRSYLSRHQYNIHELVGGMRQQIARNQ